MPKLPRVKRKYVKKPRPLKRYVVIPLPEAKRRLIADLIEAGKIQPE